MKAKEKAEELVDKMLNNQSFSEDIYDAKQCALIAVDELIKVLYDANDTDEEYGYWTDVKHEIEKL